MSDHFPKVLVLGHSFVKRLKRHIEAGSDVRPRDHFDLANSSRVFLHGVGGRTVSAIRRHDMAALKRISPDLLVLEVGTNDLSAGIRPEVLGSALDDFLSYIRSSFAVRAIAVCMVIPRRERFSGVPAVHFNEQARIFNQYISAVVNSHPWAFTWEHRGLSSLSRSRLLPDGVHLDPAGQYFLYRSYRGAILRGLRLLSSVSNWFICTHCYSFFSCCLSSHISLCRAPCLLGCCIFCQPNFWCFRWALWPVGVHSVICGPWGFGNVPVTHVLSVCPLFYCMFVSCGLEHHVYLVVAYSANLTFGVFGRPSRLWGSLVYSLPSVLVIWFCSIWGLGLLRRHVL